MKKISILVVLLTTLIWGCVKQEDSSSRRKSLAYLNFVKSKSEAIANRAKTNSRLSDYAWYIIKEDLNGAAIGATLSGGGPHFIGCAAFGAGLFSFMAHMPYYGENNCGDLICQNCTNSSYANSTNPYDNVGLIHNTVVSEILANRNSVSDIQGNNCPINYASTINEMRNAVISETGMTYSQIDSVLPHQFLMDQLDELTNSIEYSNIITESQQRLDYLEEMELISPEVKDVLEVYYATLFDLTDYQDVYEYTEELENEIEDYELNAQDEKVLYAVFSTCRYSAGMWFNGELLD